MKSSIKRVLAAVLTLAIVLSLAACTSTDPNAAPVGDDSAAGGAKFVGETKVAYNADIQEDGVKRLGIAYSTLQYAASQLLVEGYENHYQEYGFDEIVVLTADNNLETQINQIQDLINQKCDVIVVNSVDKDGVAPICKTAMDSGIAVIAVDRQIGTDVYYTLETDNKSAGRDLAMTMADYSYKDGIEDGSVHVLVCVGVMTSSAVNDRITGFRETMSYYPWMNIVAEPSATTTDEVYNAVIDTLTADPTVKGIFVVGDNDVTPAVSALRELNMLFDESDERHIMIGSVDGADNAIQAIRDGESTFCANQRFDLFCTQVLQVAQDYTNGQYIAPANNMVQLSCSMIMRSNVDHLEEQGLLWATGSL